jgi:dCMP deaminase
MAEIKYCAFHGSHEYWLDDGRCGKCADAPYRHRKTPIDTSKETGPLWYCTKHGTHRHWDREMHGECGYCADENPKPTRPSIDAYFMTIAHAVATRATCPRASVGAVLVRNGYQIACGYNGAPRGLPHCLDVGCLMVDDHCARAVHSECNAIIQAALHGVSTAGATCFITHYPCLVCSKMLINAGVVRVVYHEAYNPSAHAARFLSAAGVDVEKL